MIVRIGRRELPGQFLGRILGQLRGRFLSRFLVSVFVVSISCIFAPGSMAAADSGWPMADKVVVKKSERKLLLLRANEVLREFDINLGLVPNGDKLEEGDFRTPEGSYLLAGKNLNSEFFLSIKISYPDVRDIRQAQQSGVDPGGNIMIHGQPNNPRKSKGYYRNYDWTDGCIAVSNSDMIDIWLMTDDETPIEIQP